MPAGDYYFNDPMLESADCRIAENGKAKMNGVLPHPCDKPSGQDQLCIPQ